MTHPVCCSVPAILIISYVFFHLLSVSLSVAGGETELGETYDDVFGSMPIELGTLRVYGGNPMTYSVAHTNTHTESSSSSSSLPG